MFKFKILSLGRSEVNIAIGWCLTIPQRVQGFSCTIVWIYYYSNDDVNNIAQGSVATCRPITLLQIYCWVCQWMIFQRYVKSNIWCIWQKLWYVSFLNHPAQLLPNPKPHAPKSFYARPLSSKFLPLPWSQRKLTSPPPHIPQPLTYFFVLSACQTLFANRQALSPRGN